MSESETLSPEKRAQVLAGASAVFARDGYEGASMSRIAQEAGVSKGTLYNYYAGKAELFAAFVEEKCSAHLAQVFAPTPSGDNSPGAVLHSIGSRMLEMMLSPTGLTIHRVVTSEAAKFPALARSFYDAGPAQAIGALAAWLTEETDAGRLVVDDPVFAAEQFFALCQAHVCLRRILQLETITSPEEVIRVVDGAVTMFLRRYGPAA